MLQHVHILGLHIPMYATMVVIGAIAFVIYYKLVVVKRENIDRTTDNRLLFVSVLGFLALGASAFVMNSIFHSIEAGRIEIGGITWLGGVIGCIPAVYVLIHFLVPKEKGNAINRFSTMMPGLVLAHGFGRIGCFLGGCCYGAVTDSPLGVVFPAGSLAGRKHPDILSPDTIVQKVENSQGEMVEQTLYPSLPVLPTQLFEAIFAFALFAVMLIFYKKLKHVNVEIYCFVYGAFRFTLEFFRGDDRGDTGFVLSPSQLMSILICIGAALLILYRKKIIFKKLYRKCEIWREEAKLAPAGSAPWHSNKQSTAEIIRELHALKEDGIISDEEFETKKKELLKRL